jgi:hypothetical protein
MTAMGQKAKYSLRAHAVRFASDNGLTLDIALCPKSAQKATSRVQAAQKKKRPKAALDSRSLFRRPSMQALSSADTPKSRGPHLATAVGTPKIK